MIVWINKIYLRIHTNLIIYVIVIDFLLSNIYNMLKKHIICKIIYIYTIFISRKS